MVSTYDSFISDDEEELCPLCVEEMDIWDRNFKPCPCGYQVCQFCYNNIRQNPQLNGKCPACRRPYDDESVEYRTVTDDEWKQENAKQARREREKKQKERERKETEQSSKKHLSGMRVIQKNLVYVIGLNPNIPTEELHHTLRTDHFFGQYGKIQKIVINRRTNLNGNPGLGVYVTFARKEDAARCIAAVDGSVNDGKYLRATYGTTKYCSSYLRGQQCQNSNCMFLHEPGEEADSYTRQDLSTIQHEKTTTQAKHDSGNDISLPASVSWATKSTGTTSVVSDQPVSGISNQPNYPPLPSAKKIVASSPPPPAVKKEEPTIILPQRESPKASPTISFMEQSLSMLAELDYKYSFSSPNYSVTAFPLFSFSNKNLSTEFPTDDEESNLPSYIFTTINCPPKIDLTLREVYSMQIQPPALPPSQNSANTIPVSAYPNNNLPTNGINASNSITPQLPKNMPYKTTSPPGLKNSQELLAHLMKRGA
ncbi:hypothetical protein D0Z00_004213 [Geotrichum galactomycetum]|uniref:Uncharacterized protein n=1 Tax=Geotrichum galactomycetum TaxID=27317 RepID=A0ACB6UZ75_9ASCO|nr:hypothetical protein D0Z00_004213 [Geotrichum candidum]